MTRPFQHTVFSRGDVSCFTGQHWQPVLRPCPVAPTLYPARRWMSQTCINSWVIKAVLGWALFILLCNWAISIATNILNPLLKATRCDCELQKILGRWTLSFFDKLLFLRSIKNLDAHQSNFHGHCCCGALTVQFVRRSARKAKFSPTANLPYRFLPSSLSSVINDRVLTVECFSFPHRDYRGEM